MWYTPTVATQPEDEPLSLEETKWHLRASDFEDDDAYIQELIASARDYVEGYCGAKFAPQSVDIKCDSFDDFAHVPISPIAGVTSITYVDTSGAETTLAAEIYEHRDDAIVLAYGKQWPPRQAGSLIAVTLSVGFQDCPPAVKHAMRLWIADAYANRENAETASTSTMDALLANHRYY